MNTAFDSLVGRYVRYKEGTETLITWLAKTAGEYIDLSRMISSLGCSKNLQSAVSGGAVELRVAELVPLANVIAAANCTATIPKDVLKVAKEAIADRQECSNMYAAKSVQQTGHISEKDRSHQHFIGVLEKVLEILCPVNMTTTGPGPKKSHSQAEPKPSVVMTTNKFAGLEVQDPVVFADSTPGTTKAPREDLSRTKFTVEKRSDTTTFAVWCHLHDMRDVRLFVQDIWTKYARGDVSFLLASMVTEVAICLLKCSDDAFVALNPSLATYDKLLGFLNDDVSIILGESLTGKAKIGASAHQDLLLDLVCCKGASILHLHAVKSRRLYEDRRRKKAREPRLPLETPQLMPNQFCHVVLRNTMMILSTPAPSVKEQYIDEFLQAMGDVGSHQRTWLVSANQMYKDLFDNVRDSKSDGLAALRRATTRCSMVSNAMKEDHEAHTTGNSDPTYEWIRSTAEALRKAMLSFAIDTSAFDNGDIHSPNFDEQLHQKQAMLENPWVQGLETQLPTQAGSLLFTLKTSMLFMGSQAMSDNFAVHSIAYLYKAARHTGLMASDWHDMDCFIKSQASVGPLVPKLKAQAKSKELFVAFQEAVGSVFRTKTAKRRGDALDFELGRGRKIQIGAPVTAKLLESLCSLKPEATSRSHVSPGKIVEVLLHQLTAAENDVRGKTDSSMLRTMFSPLQLLSTFRQSFQQEEPMINFDYFGFRIECVCILEAIAMALSIKGTPHVQMAYEILSEMASKQDDGEGIGGSRLAKTAEILQGAAEVNGNNFMQSARKESSGYIPKHLRPK